MIEWSGGVMPELSKCYTEITSSQLSRERILRILAPDQVSTAVTMS